MRTPAAIALLVIAATADISCDAPSGPDAKHVLRITPTAATLTTIGETLAVAATLDGQPVRASMFVRSERRWLDDESVLDSTRLAQSRVVARTPGRTVITVSAGRLSDTIAITVTPARPVIVTIRSPKGRTIIGDGDTLLLRGFQMNRLDEAQLGVPGLHMLSSDSATARVTIPSVTPTSCGGPPALQWSTATVDVGPLVPILARKQIGGLELAVGATATLPSGDGACIRVSSAPDAQYLIAYADTRLFVRAQTLPEHQLTDSIDISLEDRPPFGAPLPSSVSTVVAAAATAVVLEDDRGPADRLSSNSRRSSVALGMRLTASGSGCPSDGPYGGELQLFCRDHPWATGEEFQTTSFDGRSGTARVLGVYGPLVLALFLPDSALLSTTGRLQADTSMRYMQSRVIPVLDSLWQLGTIPVTSNAAGQLLILMSNEGSFTRFSPYQPSRGRWSYVNISLGPDTCLRIGICSADPILQVVAHEVTHTFQMRWRYQTGGWTRSLGSLWSVEGGATFYSDIALLDYVGMNILGNRTVESLPPADPLSAVYSSYSAPVGDFTSGYSSTASFMRDLLQRLMISGGLAYRTAAREVLLGSLEGWYGVNEDGERRGPGLTSRLRASLGNEWSPEDALLDWTLSQAADDLTANPYYQNLTIQYAPPSVSTNTVRPTAMIRTGAGARPSVRRAPGNSGVFLIIDSGEGGVLETHESIAGTPSHALVWRVLRIR